MDNKKNTRGGKRSGAGRKKSFPTKTIRIPLALETQVNQYVEMMKAIAMNKKNFDMRIFKEASNPQSQIFDVSPELAALWLSLPNPINRRVRRETVNHFASIMQDGKWKLNGESIKFDSNGNLRDGQHRLHAVVKSGKTIQLQIDFGFNPQDLDDIDTGLKRTGADIATIMGYEPAKAATFSTAINWIYRYEKSVNMKPVKIDNSIIKKEADGNTALQDSVDFVHQFPRTGRILSSGVLTFLHYEMALKNREMADKFIKKLITGANIDVSDVEFKLRTMLLNDQSRKLKLPTIDKVARTIKAWNSIRRGKPIAHSNNLGLRKDENFPQII